jgi:hypothetical protein
MVPLAHGEDKVVEFLCRHPSPPAREAPSINPTPTRQMRALNTKIVTWLSRVLGSFLVLLSVLLLFGVWK